MCVCVCVCVSVCVCVCVCVLNIRLLSMYMVQNAINILTHTCVIANFSFNLIGKR